MSKFNLNEEITNAAAELDKLQAEKLELPRKLQEAYGIADSIQIVSLRRRDDEIDVFINAARIRLERLRLQSDEQRLPEAEAEAVRLIEPAQLAKKQLDEAREKYNQAEGERQNAQSDVFSLRMSIGERKRRIAGLMQEASKPEGTIVRSNWQVMANASG